MSDGNDDAFNVSKAEVFEALSHPTRIYMLRVLSERPLPFSELKRAAGLESNGLLTFHLGKLRDLVRLDQEGAYALTDQGREALRIVEASRAQTEERPKRKVTINLPHGTAILATLLIVIILLSSVAVMQQERISGLERTLENGTTIINGQSYWYTSVSNALGNDSKTLFHGVTFTMINPQSPQVGTTQWFVTGSVQCAPACSTIGIPANLTIIGTPVSVLLTRIVITFPDGSQQTSSGFGVIPSTTNSTSPLYWFSQHENPAVAIQWNPGNATLDYCVAVS